MLVLPPQSYLGWKVSISVLHAVVVGSTVYRLVHRFQLRRAWWDDYLLVFPLVMNIFYCSLMWFRFEHRVTMGTVIDASDVSQTYRILSSYWLSLLPYQLSIWSSKTVLALSLARIFPRKHPARQWSYWLVVMMVAFFLGCALVPALTCTYKSRLMVIYETTHCATGNGKTIFSITFLVVASVVGDALLIVSPLCFFWRIKLPPVERRLVLTVFCGSILPLLTAITSAVLFINDNIYPGEDYLLILIGFCNIDAAISLLVCNLTVLTTSIYRVVRRRNASQISTEETIEATSHLAPHTYTSSGRPTEQSSTSEAMSLTEISTIPSGSMTRYTEWSNVTGDLLTSTFSYKSEERPGRTFED